MLTLLLLTTWKYTDSDKLHKYNNSDIKIKPVLKKQCGGLHTDFDI